MICPKCGVQVPDDAKFCGVCGCNITAENTAAPVQQPTEETINDTEAVTESADPVTEPVNTVDAQEPEASQAEPVSETPAQEYTSYNENPQPTPQPPVNNLQQADASKKGLIILAGIAVAAIVVIILLFSLIFGGGGWKAVIKDRVKALNNRETNVKDYYIANYGEICGEFNYEQAKLIAELTDEDDWEEEMEEELEDTYDYMDEYVGDDWKAEYEIKSKKALSDSKIEDAQDSWDDELDSIEDILDTLDDIDEPEDYHEELDEDDVEELIKFYEKWLKKLEKMEVKKGYKVKIKLTVTGDDDDEKTTETTNIVKIGGKWMEDSFYFEYPSLLW